MTKTTTTKLASISSRFRSTRSQVTAFRLDRETVRIRQPIGSPCALMVVLMIHARRFSVSMLS